MVTITLGTREIPLVYTTYEMLTIQQEIAPLSKAIRLVLGRDPEVDDEKDPAGNRYGSPEHLAAAATLIRILGNAGLEEAGEEADLTDKRVLRMLKPSELANAVSGCMDAMNEGMASEFPEKEKEGPVNVTLEKINKKKEKES